MGGLAADVGRGVAIFIDEMQDLSADDVSAICASCHEISQSGLPVIVVGAGLPHLPAVLSASKSYSERLFRYQRIDRLDRAAADLALVAPAADEEAEFTSEALDAMYAATAGYPYFVQAYGKVTWDAALRSPIQLSDVREAAPEAETAVAAPEPAPVASAPAPAPAPYQAMPSPAPAPHPPAAPTARCSARTRPRRLPPRQPPSKRSFSDSSASSLLHVCC